VRHAFLPRSLIGNQPKPITEKFIKNSEQFQIETHGCENVDALWAMTKTLSALFVMSNV